MNSFWKTTLLLIGINVLLFLIGFAGNGEGIVLPLVLLPIQFFVGIVLCFFKDKSIYTIGQALLTVTGLAFIIGLSVCSMMFN